MEYELTYFEDLVQHFSHYAILLLSLSLFYCYLTYLTLVILFTKYSYQIQIIYTVVWFQINNNNNNL